MKATYTRNFWGQWMHCNVSSGINDTTVTITFDPIPGNQTNRIGKIDVSSTVPGQINSYVTIIQVPHGFVTNTSINGSSTTNPVLSLPDTVFMGSAYSYPLHIQNVGVGSLKWGLAFVNTPWIHLQYANDTTGVNDTKVQLYFYPIPYTQTNRIGDVRVTTTIPKQQLNHVYYFHFGLHRVTQASLLARIYQ